MYRVHMIAQCNPPALASETKFLSHSHHLAYTELDQLFDMLEAPLIDSIRKANAC